MNNNRIKEFVRFGIVGCIATLVHYSIYLLLSIWINITVSYTIGYIISFIGNFYFSNRYTFKTSPSFKKGIGFSLSHLINYFLQVILLHFFVSFGVKESYAPIPVYAIAVPINYLLVRFVLKNRKL